MVDICFILWVITQHYVIFSITPVVSVWALGALPVGPCILSLPPFIFWALPHFWKQDVPDLACIASCLSPRTRYLSNKLWVLYWRTLLKPSRAFGVHIAMSKLCPCSRIFSAGKARETCGTSLCAYAHTLNIRIHMSSKSPVHTNFSYGSSSTQSILVSTSSASLSSLLHLAPGWLF